MRLSEHYTSIQGEGPNVGAPTQFFRFGGCNLRCPAWPCDTQHAIDPKYRKDWEAITPVDAAARLSHGPSNVCLTGGEPFLQPAKEIEELATELRMRGQRVEAFTNGTILYTSLQLDAIRMVMDWKLPGSGESWDVPNRFENFNRMNTPYLRALHSVKFTIASEEDFALAYDIYQNYIRSRDAFHGMQVYAGVVWGKLENAELVEWMLTSELPWKLNVQVHNHIWDRTQRGI